MQKERYNDVTQFRAKLTRALRLSDVNNGADPTSTAATEAHIDMCWKLYQNSRYNRHGKLVCGTLNDLKKAKTKLGGTNSFHDGSVLDIPIRDQSSGRNWTTLANDCWILGGIHAHLPFQLVSPPVKSTFINANFDPSVHDSTRLMRVTARELLGLAAFGYKSAVNQEIDSESRRLGVRYELRCYDTAKADQATIASYLQVVRRFTQAMLKDGAAPVAQEVKNMKVA